MAPTKPEHPRALTHNLERNVCTCYDVPKKDILEAIRAGADSVEKVSQKTYGCQESQCCKAQIEKLIKLVKTHS